MSHPEPSVLLVGMGKRVRARRDALDLTQAELAKTVGLSRASIANTEAGRQELPLTTAAKLADALGLTVGALCGEEPVAELPSVRITTSHTVTCEKCGDLDTFASPDEASGFRRDHIRQHLTVRPTEE